MGDRIGGFNLNLNPTLSISTDSYDQYDCVGGLLTVSTLFDYQGDRGHDGIITDVRLLEATAAPITMAVAVTFFNANPDDVGTTITEQLKLVLAAADLTKWIGTVTLNSYETITDDLRVAENPPQFKQFDLGKGNRTLYMAITALESGTFNAATDLTLGIGLEMN